jgi:hypothetical protein
MAAVFLHWYLICAAPLMDAVTSLSEKNDTDNQKFQTNTYIKMEQRISYICIYYRGRLKKGVAIFDATGTNLKQKLLF